MSFGTGAHCGCVAELVGRSRPVSVKQLLSRMLVILVREWCMHSYWRSADRKIDKAERKVSI